MTYSSRFPVFVLIERKKVICTDDCAERGGGDGICVGVLLFF